MFPERQIHRGSAPPHFPATVFLVCSRFRGRTHAILTVRDILGHGRFRGGMKDSYFRAVQGILAVCVVTRPLTMALMILESQLELAKA